MKRIIIFFLLSVIFLTVFTGCQKTEEQLVISSPLLVDYSDSIFEISYNSEYDLIDKDAFFQPPETMTIEFCGESYTGVYKQTQPCGKGVGFVVYQYKAQKNGQNIYWSVSATGTLTEFYRISDTNGENSSNDENKKMSREACLTIVEEFLNEKIVFSNFRLIEQRTELDGYVFKYTRTVSGLPTVELVAVNIDFDGKISYYYERVAEKLNRSPDISCVDFDVAVEALYKKVDTLTEGIKKRHEIIEYQKPEFELTVLKDGSYGLYCTVEVIGKIYLTDTIYEQGGEVFVFVIPLVNAAQAQ